MNLLTHPDYVANSIDWQKFRLVYEGGRNFIWRYLRRYSERETRAEFQMRRRVSYSPSFAKSAITEIKNSIFERLADVNRKGGPDSYDEAVEGLLGGVDLNGSSMNYFIGQKVLPELLVMQKVGVFIDKDTLPDNRTRAEDKSARPYLYIYKAEDIISWSKNKQNVLISLLLRTHTDDIDDRTGLIKGCKTTTRLFKLVDGKVHYQELNEMASDADSAAVTILNLNRIPFVIFELSESLMVDVADYQIALLNLSSSDIGYILKANFPFYTEQQSGMGTIAGKQNREEIDANGNKIVVEASNTVDVGQTNGRKYGKGLERPGFIHPSSEPLQASMNKQETIKAEIRQLVHLALANLTSQRQSTESKVQDNQGLEAGLACIGEVLETGERTIGDIWAQYEGESTPPTVNYPANYSVRSEEERRKEAKDLLEMLPSIPSETGKRAILKKVVCLLIGPSVTAENDEKIEKEIDNCSVAVVLPATIILSVEAGLISNETASKVLGYPPGEADKAAKDHAERLARIAASQSKNVNGVAETSGQPGQDAKNQKQQSQSADTNPDGGIAQTRGEAK